MVGTAGSSKVLTSVEAKAGEPFGETLDQYRSSAAKRIERGKNTNAPERLQGLLARFAPDLDPDSDEVGSLRYQLFSGLVGTVAAAQEVGADHAVFMIHELVTDDQAIPESNDDLNNFAKAVFQTQIPRSTSPWCLHIPNQAGVDSLNLYLAKATTDLRPRKLD